MSSDRSSGVALIVGTLATLAVMALHPTGRDLFEAAGRAAGPARVNLLVHGVAIASCPLLLFGALGINRRFPAELALPRLAIVFWGFALVAVMLAATASGLIAPRLIEWIAAAGVSQSPMHDVLSYNGLVNQAFAKIHVAMSSTAILLWSIAIARTHTFSRAIGWFGMVAAVLTLAGLFSGHLTLDVHGFGLVVLLQAIWLTAIGIKLSRNPEVMTATG